MTKFDQIMEKAADERHADRCANDSEHDPDCRWERTTLAECEYRATHFYCPHPEHACNCAAPAERVKSDFCERLRKLVDACVVPDFKAKLAATLAEYEAWDRVTDKRN